MHEELVTVFTVVTGMSVEIIVSRSIGLEIAAIMRPETSYEYVVSAVCCFPISQR
jgi:hypothetical protein